MTLRAPKLKDGMQIPYNNMPEDNPMNTGELLRTLFEATAHATGDEFFEVLVRHLATSLEACFKTSSTMEST